MQPLAERVERIVPHNSSNPQPRGLITGPDLSAACLPNSWRSSINRQAPCTPPLLQYQEKEHRLTTQQPPSHLHTISPAWSLSFRLWKRDLSLLIQHSEVGQRDGQGSSTLGAKSCATSGKSQNSLCHCFPIPEIGTMWPCVRIKGLPRWLSS